MDSKVSFIHCLGSEVRFKRLHREHERTDVDLKEIKKKRKRKKK